VYLCVVIIDRRNEYSILELPYRTLPEKSWYQGGAWRIIVPTAFRLHFLGREFVSSNPHWTACSQPFCNYIRISYTIIVATIRCVRPFIIATSTNFRVPAYIASSIPYIRPSMTATSTNYRAPAYVAARFYLFFLGNRLVGLKGLRTASEPVESHTLYATLHDSY